MRIAVDLDSILADIMKALLPRLNQKYGLNLIEDQITEWDYPINGRSIGEDIKEHLADPVFVLTMPEVEGAKQALEELYKDHEIIVATGRPFYSKRYTYLWLDGRFKYDNIIFSREKTVQNLKCDVLVDDSDIYMSKFLKSGGKGILLRKPWNQNFVHDMSKHTCFVANNWEGIVECIKYI